MNWLKSYFSSSRTERRGIAALLLLALVLLVVYITLPYFYPAPAIVSDPSLAAAFERYSKEHPANETYAADRKDEEPVREGTLFPFDPNTLDSAGFIRLGLRPKTVRMLLNWRRKGKTFYRKEDLKPLYTLKEEEYARLEPYITIDPVAGRQPYAPFPKPRIPDRIDLNTTDSATLVLLNGIGPTLAHKIIRQRNALGGFVKHEQLLEVYRFPDSTFQMLKQKLIINTRSVKKYNLNTATAEELKAHPYIGEKVAHNIVLFREGLKRYDNIEQLRQVPLMNEEIYRKIAPYFLLE
jgi:competence protein ComEA